MPYTPISVVHTLVGVFYNKEYPALILQNISRATRFAHLGMRYSRTHAARAHLDSKKLFSETQSIVKLELGSDFYYHASRG